MAKPTTTSSNIPSTEAVTYVCTMTNMWTEDTHPIDYPSSGSFTAHYSALIVAGHSDEYQMWNGGDMASPGVQEVAESGRDGAIVEEFNAAGDAVSNYKIASTTSAESLQQTVAGIMLDGNHTHLSSITMIAPSPDWFIGFHDINAVDETSGTWYETITLESQPWDSGTDDGETYLADNAVTDPQVAIFEITKNTVPATSMGVLLSADSSTVLPMAKFVCSLSTGVTGSSGSAAAGQQAGIVSVIAVMAGVWLSLFGL